MAEISSHVTRCIVLLEDPIHPGEDSQPVWVYVVCMEGFIPQSVERAFHMDEWAQRRPVYKLPFPPVETFLVGFTGGNDQVGKQFLQSVENKQAPSPEVHPAVGYISSKVRESIVVTPVGLPASVDSPDSPTPVCIPPEYHDLAEVFSKSNATKLPPHRSYDCGIELLANTTVPKARVYPLTQAEEIAMEEYTREALAQGFIRRSTSPAFQTAECLFNHVFRFFGIPEDIVSDRGVQFTSRVWRAFMRKLGVSVSLTSGYHPQSNGQCERANQELGEVSVFTATTQSDWATYLPWAEMAQNSLTSSTTSLTPFQCILGFQPPLMPWSPQSSDVPAVDHWMRRSEEVWEQTHRRIESVAQRQKEQADKHRGSTPVYSPGDRVWLSSRDLRLPGGCKKLSPKYICPFGWRWRDTRPEAKMRPFILVLTTVPPHTDSLGVSTKTKAGLVTEDDPLPF
ncbi:hypothetical protein NFI96_003257 [Prochilodus magdalenae]|nr:hypothetical protein NFI96_003257 [Prochilodus magdalenae]